MTGLRPTVLELWIDNGHVILVVHLGVCCAGVWVACTPRTCTIGTIHAPPGPRWSMGISDCHILVPYLWIRPISAWVRFGVKNQKKVDNAVVFGLRGTHNHTHLGHVMGYVVIGDVFRWFGAFFGVRGPPEGGPRTRVLIEHYKPTGVNGIPDSWIHGF